MAQKERLEAIRQSVKRDRRVVVSVLSKQYDVTEETIRRDLEKLEQEGLVNRTYGGAVLNVEQMAENVDYVRRSMMHHAEKTLIGNLAAGLIGMNATIGTDSSSTVVEAVRMLQNRPGITVMTNSVQIVREFHQAEMNILSTGGMVNKKTFSMQGNVARKVLSEYYADLILISCNALDVDGGIYDSNEQEAEIKRFLISRGAKIYLLADHYKFDRMAFVKLTDIDKVDTLITDKEPGEVWKRALKEKGVKLVYPK